MDRRRFLGSAAALSGAGMVAACRDADGQAAADAQAAPDADGRPDPTTPRQQPPTLTPPLSRVGVQLYTVRSLMADDVEGTLSAVARIGYDEVEFAGLFGHSPAQIRTWLDAAGLRAPAAHIDPAELAPTAIDRTLDAAAAIGYGWLVQAFIPAESRTPDGYREVADHLNEAGERASAAGVRIGYHNHAFEFEALGDTTGYGLLLDRLDPALVDLELDVHWAVVGGADPAGLFEAYPGRFPLCHVKDLDGEGVMVDVGAGIIDWSGLFARSETAGLIHYFVEHDQPEDPLASIEASYRYLTGAGVQPPEAN